MECSQINVETVNFKYPHAVKPAGRRERETLFIWEQTSLLDGYDGYTRYAGIRGAYVAWAAVES